MVESDTEGRDDTEHRAATVTTEPDDALSDQALALIAVAASGRLPLDQVLAALTELRQLRTSLDRWEPRLIAVAREHGASWAQLAGALGVASRQAAERRYLRLRQPEQEPAGVTRDERVQAVRDRRAEDRAVSAWARTNGADLRQLAGQISALTDLGPAAQPSLDRLHEALGGSDTAALVPLLAAAQEHLPVQHSALADRVADIDRRARQVRQDSRQRRAEPAGRTANRP